MGKHFVKNDSGPSCFGKKSVFPGPDRALGFCHSRPGRGKAQSKNRLDFGAMYFIFCFWSGLDFIPGSALSGGGFGVVFGRRALVLPRQKAGRFFIFRIR